MGAANLSRSRRQAYRISVHLIRQWQAHGVERGWSSGREQASGTEAQRLHETTRSREPIASEPSEGLLTPVSGHEHADHQPCDEQSLIHDLFLSSSIAASF